MDNKKPAEWNHFVFSEKLKWYAKKNNPTKNLFADKYNIKKIIDELNIPDLHYAKIVPYIKPFNTKTDIKFVVPVTHEFTSSQEQIDSILERLISKVDSPSEMWNILANDYDIHLLNDDNCPPKSYVIKLNLSWNTMIFVCNNRIVKIVYGKKDYLTTIESFPKWYMDCLSDYKKNIPPKIFVEEFIGFNLKVYEVFCIYGKPRILSVYFETNESYESNYLIYKDDDDENNTIKFKLLTGDHLIPDSKPLNTPLDETVATNIINMSKDFAKFFEFVRVDFYHSKGKIYFSECTFKPGALKTIKWRNIGKILSQFWTKKSDFVEYNCKNKCK